MKLRKIGKFIENCRNEQLISKEEMSNKLDVSVKDIIRWEKGRCLPNHNTLNKLCDLFHISLLELVRGEKLKEEDLEKYKDVNVEGIISDYYRANKIIKAIAIFLIIVGFTGIVWLFKLFFAIGLITLDGITSKVEQTTEISEYKSVIGPEAKKEYRYKLISNESIFPNSLDDLNVGDFKMVYYNPFDAQYLAYLVVDYDEKEVKRLNDIGIEKYKGIYGVTGFSKYKLLAMNSDEYYGFIYAITDNKKIIYVEIMFCNYFMDLDYHKYINDDYLPDGFDATGDNLYRKKMLKR